MAFAETEKQGLEEIVEVMSQTCHHSTEYVALR